MVAIGAAAPAHPPDTGAAAVWPLAVIRAGGGAALDVAAEPRYRPFRELGRGSHGVALLATDAVTGRRVVLKERFRGGAEADEARAALVREAAALRRVAHPHVVRLLDVTRGPHGLTLVLEFAPRGDLASWLQRDGPFSARSAVATTVQVLDGLAAAHAAGVVHGDVKPANVLLAAHGAVLADFSVARDVGAPSGPDGTGGTPAFRAPDVRRGTAVHPADDVYGAAALLHTLVTGRTPARGANGAAHVDAALPPAMRNVVARGLAARRADRYVSGCAFARALRQLPRSALGSRRDAASWVSRGAPVAVSHPTATAQPPP